MTDRRASDRVATSLLGTMVLDERLTTYLVRDFSLEGARLWIAGAVELPKSFGLRIERHGISHGAQLRWRTADEVGVEFKRQGAVKFF